jgi:hypothetical protein
MRGIIRGELRLRKRLRSRFDVTTSAFVRSDDECGPITRRGYPLVHIACDEVAFDSRDCAKL